MKLTDFKKGDRVIYTPTHEHGVVISVTDKYVFVKYDTVDYEMATGDEPFAAKATSPEDLYRPSWQDFDWQPHEPPGRTAYVEELRSTLKELVEWMDTYIIEDEKQGVVALLEKAEELINRK